MYRLVPWHLEMSTLVADVDRFLSTPEANFGLATLKAQQLIAKIPSDDDEAYKYFVKFLIPSQIEKDVKDVQPVTSVEERAARSYRAMNVLKQDLSGSLGRAVLIKGPTQAGLLVKDLLLGLTTVSSDANQRYSVFHIRELLDALVEAYPEKAMAAAAAGGKQGAHDHLGPLLQSDQTLSVLTHLVCIGATGRKGIASAEKSAQHTAMYHHMHNDPRNKISLGQRRKFVKAMSDFSLIDQLSCALTSKAAGEELCECILTIVEVIGYPPEEPQIPGYQQQDTKDKGKEEMVGEDMLLAPLANPEWWKRLFEIIEKNDCTYEQREAICRTCNHVFALATGNSSRICKSHAPATDATEQTSEKLVVEKEEKVVNRFVEWGLTDNMHAALRNQLPLLIKILNLPTENILSHQATQWISPGQARDTSEEAEDFTIPHPGRYRTQPLGSWRVQLLSLLREILTYRGKSNTDDKGNTKPHPCVLAMDVIMELPVPPEFLKSKKKKDVDSELSLQVPEVFVYNPWPALCSLVWAYPNNDFYHIIFFQMLQAVVIEHHEASLRLILQSSKFLSRAVSSIKDEKLRGFLLNCLNLMHLRSKSLPPSAFLHQYLGSHDGWKENVDTLTELTFYQQKPIKGEEGMVVNLNLGSLFASKLGLSDLDEWDAKTATTVSESSLDEGPDGSLVDDGQLGDAKKRINNNNKKGKKKKKK